MTQRHKRRTETEPLLGDNISYSSYLRSSSWSGESDLYDDEDEIKKKLQWYFKNPYEKYKDRGRKPFKLIIQIIKIILVTLQATIFAVDEFSVVEFNRDNVETFRNLFLIDYAGQQQHELYTKQAVYKHMFYTWQQYYNFDHIMIGSYELQIRDGASHYPPMLLCVHASKKIHDSIKNDHVLEDDDDYYVIGSNGDEHTKTSCRNLNPPKISSKNTTLEEFITTNNLTTNFEWILDLKLKFSFTMNYTVVHKTNSPDCYQFDVQVLFDNSNLDGVMTVELDSKVDFYKCRKKGGKLHIKEQDTTKVLWTVFDISIVIICIFSFSLCIRSFKRHYRLAKDASRFFREYRHEEFTISDQLNFLSFWLVLVSVSDLSTMAGSLIKILVDWMEIPELYSVCSICFGIAVLFSWIGILRYLGFMEGYNTLLVTLKTAFPTIIRFVLCVSLIYIGFTVCGWIVFGPYHHKFRDISVTSECLFALINGDDMFATFSGMDDSDLLVWYFSKVYLYIFISLFIFVVLSLFIGIMADTYERIRDYGHPPKTRIELFMEGKEYNQGEEQQHRHGAGTCRHEQITELESGTENSSDDEISHIDVSSVGT